MGSKPFVTKVCVLARNRLETESCESKKHGTNGVQSFEMHIGA